MDEAVVKILMPLWSLNLFDYGFVLPLAKSLSAVVEQLHISYIIGTPRQDLRENFSFRRINLPFASIRSKITRFLLSRRRLLEQVEDLDIDVFFTLSDLWMQEFCRYCSEKMDVPYAVRLRGNHRKVRKAMNVSFPKEEMLNYLETRSLRDADLVIPNSRELAEKAEEWGIREEKITPPVWNGVDTQMFKPMTVSRPREFTVAYAGRISPEKRVPQILEVAKNLPDIHFMIAGKKQIDISFPETVEYLGALRFPEMPEFYNKADLVILPSATEGFPNMVLEAYACGKPVLVATEAFPVELSLFGSVADLDDFESEIEALRKADLKALGRQARSYVQEQYTWEAFAQSVVKYVGAVIG